jgi:hypothetical protein
MDQFNNGQGIERFFSLITGDPARATSNNAGEGGRQLDVDMSEGTDRWVSLHSSGDNPPHFATSGPVSGNV